MYEGIQNLIERKEKENLDETNRKREKKRRVIDDEKKKRAKERSER